MCVEMDQRQGAVLFGMGFEQRIGDEVIAAQGQHQNATVDDGAGVFDDGRHNRQGIVPIEPAIAVIDNRQIFERIESPGKRFQLGQLHRRCAHALWSHACAAAERYRYVQRNAADGNVNAGQIAGVLAAHERQRTAIGIFNIGSIE
jgi:hypothetical protein